MIIFFGRRKPKKSKTFFERVQVMNTPQLDTEKTPSSLKLTDLEQHDHHYWRYYGKYEPGDCFPKVKRNHRDYPDYLESRLELAWDKKQDHLLILVSFEIELISIIL